MVQIVEIVADRFAVATDRRVIDLVTGAPVVLKVGVGGSPGEQTRWTIRCDVLCRVRHPRLAALVDYGGLGESQRFEAWQCGPPWRGAPEERARAVRATSHYLGACNLTDGCYPRPMCTFDGRAVVLPRDQTGYPRRSQSDRPGDRLAPETVETMSIDNCAICIVDRRVDAVLADLFASLGGSRPHVISVWGPPGSGRTTTRR